MLSFSRFVARRPASSLLFHSRALTTAALIRNRRMLGDATGSTSVSRTRLMGESECANKPARTVASRWFQSLVVSPYNRFVQRGSLTRDGHGDGGESKRGLSV